jgi:predicted CoA-binding protein
VNESETIRDFLTAKTIAVVGLSADAEKPSHFVSEYMQRHGYRIIPINPSVETVLGEKSYKSLTDLPKKPDLVNVFRGSSVIPRIVEEMERLGLCNLWVQQGIINEEAAEKAEASGIRVVMDRCIMVEHRKSGLS